MTFMWTRAIQALTNTAKKEVLNISGNIASIYAFILGCYEARTTNLNYELQSGNVLLSGGLNTTFRHGREGTNLDQLSMRVSYPDGHNKLLLGRCKRIRFTMINRGNILEHMVVKNLNHGSGKFITWCGLYITKVGI